LYEPNSIQDNTLPAQVRLAFEVVAKQQQLLALSLNVTLLQNNQTI
jgi:hypothetical protein